MRSRSPTKHLASALVGGTLITLAFAIGPSCLQVYRYDWLPTTLVAASSDEAPDGLRTITWKSNPLGDQLETFKSRGAYYTGLPLIVEKERLRAWMWLPHMAAWKNDLVEPWNEEFTVSFATGWPWRAVVGTHVRRTEQIGGRTDHSVAGGVLINDPVLEKILLPLRPLPLGFALDVLFWSTLVGMALWGARQTRAALRRRRGLCPHCGHSAIANSERCPECGIAVRS
jgi:hypothetical protein